MSSSKNKNTHISALGIFFAFQIEKKHFLQARACMLCVLNIFSEFLAYIIIATKFTLNYNFLEGDMLRITSLVYVSVWIMLSEAQQLVPPNYMKLFHENFYFSSEQIGRYSLSTGCLWSSLEEHLCRGKRKRRRKRKRKRRKREKKRKRSEDTLDDSFHEGSVHVFDEGEHQDHFLARVFKDESWIGISMATKDVGCHHHGQAGDVHLCHWRILRGREHLKAVEREQMYRHWVQTMSYVRQQSCINGSYVTVIVGYKNGVVVAVLLFSGSE